MGVMPSRFSLSAFVNTIQSTVPRRPAHRVEPSQEFQPNLFVDTPVLATRRGRYRRFRSRFWKRSRNRGSCPCQKTHDDDYASVFGRARTISIQSLPPLSSVRCCRPELQSPLTPPAEFKLVIGNIEIERQASGSTLNEKTTTTPLNCEPRVVQCRHCKNGASTCVSASSSCCPTPQPPPLSRPVCRACCIHNLLPHDCSCFIPPTSSMSSRDALYTRFQRNILSPVIAPCGRTRTQFSVVTTKEIEQPKFEEVEDHFIESETVPLSPPPSPSTRKSVQDPESVDSPPCVCGMPSKSTCPCDKRLFEAMNPLNTCKNFIFLILILALVAWIIAFIVIGG